MAESSPYFFLDPAQSKILYPQMHRDTMELSLDIGRTRINCRIQNASLVLPDGMELPLPPANLLNDPEDIRSILIFKNGVWQKWQHFDEITGKFYKAVFVAPGKPPTIEISGIKMHVTQEGDPALDTRNKLKALGRAGGIALDICTGLGYSAIAFSRLATVTHVLSIEINPVMVQFCRENPWSQELFTSSKIQVIIADAARIISGFQEQQFGAILLDPPRYSLAPELYEERFYRELWRILKFQGRLYHYTGDPGKMKGRGLPERTATRLQQAGFSRVKKCYQGVCAGKF